MIFGDEKKCLTESKQENNINYAECGHVSKNHAVYHSHKRSSQRNGSENGQSKNAKKYKH